MGVRGVQSYLEGRYGRFCVLQDWLQRWQRDEGPPLLLVDLNALLFHCYRSGVVVGSLSRSEHAELRSALLAWCSDLTALGAQLVFVGMLCIVLRGPPCRVGLRLVCGH